MTTLKNNVDTLNTTVNNLTAASPSRGYYIGLSSTTPLNGMFQVAGSDTGIASVARSARRPPSWLTSAFCVRDSRQRRGW